MLVLPACGEPLDEVDAEFRHAGWWNPDIAGEPDVKLYHVEDESSPEEIDPECLIWDIQDHLNVSDPNGDIVLIMDGNFLFTPDGDGQTLQCIVAGNTVGVPSVSFNRHGHPKLEFEPVLTLRGNKLYEGTKPHGKGDVAYSIASRWVFEGHVRDRDFLYVADKVLTSSNRFRKLLLGVLASGACGVDGPTPQ
jgi:hypothetical protein